MYIKNTFCSHPAETTSKKKGGAWKKKKKKRQASHGNDSEAGEETDEGEVESREVDYMSESSSDSENEFQVKKIFTTFTTFWWISFW